MDTTFLALCDGNQLSLIDSPHKGPVGWSLDVFLAWTDCWINSWVASYLRLHDGHVMSLNEVQQVNSFEDGRWNIRVPFQYKDCHSE